MLRWVQFRNEVLKQPNGKDILVKGRPQNVAVEWINDQIRELIRVSVHPPLFPMPANSALLLMHQCRKIVMSQSMTISTITGCTA